MVISHSTKRSLGIWRKRSIHSKTNWSSNKLRRILKLRSTILNGWHPSTNLLMSRNKTGSRIFKLSSPLIPISDQTLPSLFLMERMNFVSQKKVLEQTLKLSQTHLPSNLKKDFKSALKRRRLSRMRSLRQRRRFIIMTSLCATQRLTSLRESEMNSWGTWKRSGTLTTQLERSKSLRNKIRSPFLSSLTRWKSLFSKKTKSLRVRDTLSLRRINSNKN